MITKVEKEMNWESNTHWRWVEGWTVESEAVLDWLKKISNLSWDTFTLNLATCLIIVFSNACVTIVAKRGANVNPECVRHIDGILRGDIDCLDRLGRLEAAIVWRWNRIALLILESKRKTQAVLQRLKKGILLGQLLQAPGSLGSHRKCKRPRGSGCPPDLGRSLQPLLAHRRHLGSLRVRPKCHRKRETSQVCTNCTMTDHLKKGQPIIENSKVYRKKDGYRVLEQSSQQGQAEQHTLAGHQQQGHFRGHHRCLGSGGHCN